MAPVLVDPAISAAKLARQLADWDTNAEIYRRRGWILLDRGELHVEVGFACPLPITPMNDVPAIPLAVRFEFDNYDLWPPSLRVIDPITGRWLERARINALDFERVHGDGTVEQAFVFPHPDTGKVFLCKRGVREYHTHPEHSGDDWLLYRGAGHGTLVGLCGILWRLTARTVTGMSISARRITAGENVAIVMVSELIQQDPDAAAAEIQAQVAAQQAAAAQNLAGGDQAPVAA
jgi:hypothetical protein